MRDVAGAFHRDAELVPRPVHAPDGAPDGASAPGPGPTASGRRRNEMDLDGAARSRTRFIRHGERALQVPARAGLVDEIVLQDPLGRLVVAGPAVVSPVFPDPYLGLADPAARPHRGPIVDAGGFHPVGHFRAGRRRHAARPVGILERELDIVRPDCGGSRPGRVRRPCAVGPLHGGYSHHRTSPDVLGPYAYRVGRVGLERRYEQVGHWRGLSIIRRFDLVQVSLTERRDPPVPLTFLLDPDLVGQDIYYRRRSRRIPPHHQSRLIRHSSHRGLGRCGGGTRCVVGVGRAVIVRRGRLRRRRAYPVRPPALTDGVDRAHLDLVLGVRVEVVDER